MVTEHVLYHMYIHELAHKVNDKHYCMAVDLKQWVEKSSVFRSANISLSLSLSLSLSKADAVGII